jgi:hypothetical protein
MEYRDVEELGQSVDVWQVRFGDGWKLYFEVSPGVD